jgi:PPOX class probable F420-dependent enzyme
MAIPEQIRGRSYISLATFRKNGLAVQTPVWFGEDDGKLYVKTRGDAGKVKRVRNNPQVRIAPCNIWGRVSGPEFTATARLLPAEDSPRAAKIVGRKYWLARLSLSNKKNAYLEIVP